MLSRRLIFFFKSSKLDVDFRNAAKKLAKVFCFLDDYIFIGCRENLLLQREFFSSAVSVLRNSPKISDITTRDIFEFNFVESD